MYGKLLNNQVTIAGEVISEFAYQYEVYGEKFYRFDLRSPRLSDASDIIPITVSERLIDVSYDYRGSLMKIKGQYRSYNLHSVGKNKLLLYVFAREAKFVDGMIIDENANKIVLDGYICKTPVYRHTPLGREIADLLLAVNRPYGKSDYIPCICWGRDAKFARELNVGDRVMVTGRIQSREYQKKMQDYIETRTAYEVSICKIGLTDEVD